MSLCLRGKFFPRFEIIPFERKIGFRLTGFKRRKLESALNTLAEIGYQGVELCLEHNELDPDNRDRWSSSRLSKFLYQIGLKASAVSFHGKESPWDEKRRNCIAGMELANELGVRTFISGSIRGDSPDDFTQMCRFIEEMCHFAQRYNIDFAVEPEPGTLIDNSAAMTVLLNAVDSPRLKVNLDIGHSYMTEPDLYEDIIRWGKLIVHTHIEDIKGKIHRHLLPGEGELDFKRAFAAFDEIDYSGFFTIDLYDIQDSPEYYAQQGYDALWQQIRL
ncbi:MAG: sugar phosphate isomerase/epimerase [candidate division Zixibacteria bacterium]|nr:sugar phosphate isomerase/epimerase [Candidatus Tariuqbacter arcticus]